MCFFQDKEKRPAIMSFSFPGAALVFTDVMITRQVPVVKKPVV